METATDLVATAAKLSARVQNGHHDFEGGKPRALMMLFYRNAAPVILDSHRAVGMDDDGDGVSIARHDFVNTVIDDFINEVVQAALVGCANIHARTHTYRF